jgi:hypothetical protein
MSFRHVVAPGECLSSIAFGYGFEPDAIWSDGENQKLREERESFNLLRPGDVVVVPELALREETCATGQTHRFKRKSVPEKFRVRMVDDEAPLADKPYRLTIDALELSGRTDAEGWIEQFIPPDARKGRLVLVDEVTGEDRIGDDVIEFELGLVAPLEFDGGIRERLVALGYLDGEDGTDEGFAAALREFQTDHELERTGELDDDTLDALEEAYGA